MIHPYTGLSLFHSLTYYSIYLCKLTLARSEMQYAFLGYNMFKLGFAVYSYTNNKNAETHC